MDDVAIKIDKLQKVFRLPHEKRSSVKSLFINFYRDGLSMQKSSPEWFSFFLALLKILNRSDYFIKCR